MLQIVIPMAGLGARFKDAGYEVAKPFLEIQGIPMIIQVIRNLTPRREHKFYLICREEHRATLEDLAGQEQVECEILSTPITTQGAAETVMIAAPKLDADEPLMIANCDQIIGLDIEMYLKSVDLLDSDGCLMTMESNDPKWSFVKLDVDGYVETVIEKEVISNQATTGIYNFRRTEDFTTAAKLQIEGNMKTLGEFYVAPIYNELIKQGRKISTLNVGALGGSFHGIGTPDDFEHYCREVN